MASRYFPKSFANFRIENPVPAELFSDTETISCEVCGADLLDSNNYGIYITLTPSTEYDDEGNVIFQDKQIKEIHFACKGDCDDKICEKYKGQYHDQWEDIDNLKNPTLWIKLLMAFINGIYENHDLSEEAFKTMKQMFIRSFPYVARNLTSKERERIKTLLQFGLLD